MGLDMYLTKKTYIGAHYEHRKVTGSIDIKIDNKKIDIDFNKVSEITEQVGYWRKANHIHNWFVQEVQDNIDECQESWVPTEKLQELLSLCQDIYIQLDDNNMEDIEKIDEYSKKKYTIREFKNKDDILKSLPPTCGFFFGSYHIDKWYKQDIKDTIDILEPIKNSDDIYYQASW